MKNVIKRWHAYSPHWLPLLITIVAGLTGTVTFAAPLVVSNSSFESPTGSSLNGPLDPANGSIGAWNYNRTGLLAPTLTSVTFGLSSLATDGIDVCTMKFTAGVLASEALNQDLGIVLLPNSVYTLRFDADQASALTLLTNASASITAGASPVATLNDATLLGLLDGFGPLQPVSLQFITGAVAPAGNLGIQIKIGGVAQVLGSGLVVDKVGMDVAPALVPFVVSRKMHGPGAFDIYLPLTGAVGIE